MQFPAVTIYTTKTCQYCKATKDLLHKHNVPFDEIDVGADPTKAREMIEKSGQMGVPVIFIGDDADKQMIIGFDESALRHALSL